MNRTTAALARLAHFPSVHSTPVSDIVFWNCHAIYLCCKVLSCSYINT